MEFMSETGKIPKGYGYIVKPSSLVSALRAAGVELDTRLVRHHAERLFDAYFWPPAPNVPSERLYITAGSARARDLPELRQRVEREALPTLVRWISGIVSLDQRSPIRRESQSIELLPPRDGNVEPGATSP